jgi:hypothetical protein
MSEREGGLPGADVLYAPFSGAGATFLEARPVGPRSSHAASTLLAAARGAFADGLHTVAVVAAVILASVAVLIVTTLRRIPAIGATPTPEAAPAPVDDQDSGRAIGSGVDRG